MRRHERHAEQAKVARRRLREAWGGLTVRTINLMRKHLRVESLEEMRRASPSYLDLIRIKGMGQDTLAELSKVLPSLDEEQRSLPHYLILDPPETPRTAAFFRALMEAAGALPPGEEGSAEAACMAGPFPAWCLGVVRVRRRAQPPRIEWRCPRCDRGGDVPQPQDRIGDGWRH